jgi:hypothetical protein
LSTITSLILNSSKQNTTNKSEEHTQTMDYSGGSDPVQVAVGPDGRLYIVGAPLQQQQQQQPQAQAPTVPAAASVSVSPAPQEVSEQAQAISNYGFPSAAAALQELGTLQIPAAALLPLLANVLFPQQQIYGNGIPPSQMAAPHGGIAVAQQQALNNPMNANATIDPNIPQNPMLDATSNGALNNVAANAGYYVATAAPTMTAFLEDPSTLQQWQENPSGQQQVEDPNSGIVPGRPPVCLYMTCDDQNLSNYQCLARKQIEVFQARPEDVAANAQGRNRPIKLGQVGIRCRHCSIAPPKQRKAGAVYFPSKASILFSIPYSLQL